MRGRILGGRYALERQIGEGGMGEVWEARDDTLGRPVAVKVITLLSGSGSRGDEARARFLREARITAALQHPNIVTVHDLGEVGAAAGGAPFLVMELLRGESLQTVTARGPVPLPQAARWGAQICDALAEAHAAGILHRDIKPSNIQVASSGTVKVLDFGIARAADPYATAHRLTQTGFIVGTPPYMAPEQARGHPEPRSDLYALGCLLFELITGRLPFQSPDTMGYITAHLTQEPPAPSSVRGGIPAAWDELVLKLLRKDPARRYADAPALARALRRLESAPLPARTEARRAEALTDLATALRRLEHRRAATRAAAKQTVTRPPAAAGQPSAAPPKRWTPSMMKRTAVLVLILAAIGGWVLLRGSPNAKAKSACSQAFQAIQAFDQEYRTSPGSLAVETELQAPGATLGDRLAAMAAALPTSPTDTQNVTITLGNLSHTYQSYVGGRGTRGDYYNSFVSACKAVGSSPS
ncbi:serine/threonine-protein kinase [Mangrovactinospora gilvigrisea]|uniref:serine/threonine-protein kinase n=1 Tax=Mangrovactinospora gilvigrisea TaxID=1428644 RepID=UPI000A65FE1C|nr:serine/threonine-protein kinase [Mangrovactinospora gilvigrisea]